MKSVANSESVIQQVMDQFHNVASHLSGSAQMLQQENNSIKHELAEALLSLQFHNRVGQVLSQVRNNVHRLHRYLQQYLQVILMRKNGWLGWR